MEEWRQERMETERVKEWKVVSMKECKHERKEERKAESSKVQKNEEMREWKPERTEGLTHESF